MNELTTTYEWKDLNWKKIQRQVWKLQKRIFRASQVGNVRLVRKLQKLLTNSYSVKLLATRRVTQDNAGKKTAGIDGYKALTPQKRFELANSLNVKKGCKVKPLKRVWIDKPGKAEKRPLGIPAMKDRALQAVVKMAIEPEWEAKFEPNSYGFRIGRNCHDAIEMIFKTLARKPKYVLDADIKGCFDNINHEHLLNKLDTYPTLHKIIRAWLKAGVMDKGEFKPTEQGTPQGGVISPLLANVALHGMEQHLRAIAGDYQPEYRIGRKFRERKLTVVRYADDFVLIHEDLTMLQRCRYALEEWLKDIGLELKESKTQMTDSLTGFDFLGFHIRQQKCSTRYNIFGLKTIITPSKKAIKSHVKELGDIIRTHRSVRQEVLIQKLNPKIQGWAGYYSHQCSKETFGHIDHIVWQQLRRWCNQRHPNKGSSYARQKYWHTYGRDNHRFSAKQGDEFTAVLALHKETKIIRHTKVRGEASPFDGNEVYWATRMLTNPMLNGTKHKLIRNQKGKCCICGQFMTDEDTLHIDHRTPKALGGTNKLKNLQLIHAHCHQQKTAQDLLEIRGLIDE